MAPSQNRFRLCQAAPASLLTGSHSVPQQQQQPIGPSPPVRLIYIFCRQKRHLAKDGHIRLRMHFSSAVTVAHAYMCQGYLDMRNQLNPWALGSTGPKPSKIMRAVEPPEPLSLSLGHGGWDKVSWLPEGRVFSNVQKEKMMSKFLKGSVLKRVFGSHQMRWANLEEAREAPSPTFPGSRKRQRSSYNKVERRTGESYDPNLQESSTTQENLSPWKLDSEVLIPENKILPPGRDSAAGGKINKSTQNSKQGIFHLWSYPLNEGNTMENRELENSSVESGVKVTTNTSRIFHLSHSLVNALADRPVMIPLGLYWPYADGDFSKARNEFHLNSSSTIENNSGDALSIPRWNLKSGHSSLEENLTDESDLSESEKASDSLLSYFQKMELNLKPEPIENVEKFFTEDPVEVFQYPDFLPPPFNTLDLHKVAVSKCESWKMTTEPPESSLGSLINRLLDLERLQQATIQKERTRPQSTFCTPIVSERPSSSKAVLKMRQAKLPDPSSFQIPCVDKSREKRKNNSGSSKPEQNASRWNWSNAGKYKWNSRPPSLKNVSTTKQLTVTCDDFKNSKSSTLNPCQELSPKPTTGQPTQSLVKMVSTRCLPPRSPVLISAVPLSFPENQREEVKASRSKRKLYRRSILLNRPFYIQKLNCLSPSFIAKGKHSPIVQK
ncbi:protein FAM217A [Perognathus longimembris pacificus]|uniref:protein FAM217A n=1 Tax=Perognathus longimembris pacificus TaxID=214514 RepID=UPI002018654A|nr:protein FAM217A [Perognathus longimembris pacificus]